MYPVNANTQEYTLERVNVSSQASLSVTLVRDRWEQGDVRRAYLNFDILPTIVEGRTLNGISRGG